MTDKERKVLLIGSMPFENEEDAMRRALNMIGSDLMSLPDGEIGEKSEKYPQGNRAAWVQAIIDVCEQDEENWRVIDPGVRNEQGFPVSYEKGPRLKPKRLPSEMHRYLDFNWLTYFKRSYPVFKKLREEYDLPDLKFQVGLPTGIGITFGMMGPLTAIRYAPAFNRRMAYEANEMLKIADPEDIIFQLETPGELAMAYKLPRFLAGLATRTVLGLAKKIDPAAPIGIHLCFGDLNHEALIKAKTLKKMVAFSNKIVAKWPKSHPLKYIHYPLAEAKDPPPLDPDYYEPLRKIKLPTGVRFVAGFVHEKLPEKEHRQLLQTIERIRGHKVDVASSCGLGRRPPDIAEDLMKISEKLVDEAK